MRRLGYGVVRKVQHAGVDSELKQKQFSSPYTTHIVSDVLDTQGEAKRKEYGNEILTIWYPSTINYLLTPPLTIDSPAVLPAAMMLVAPAKNDSPPPNGPMPIHRRAKHRDRAVRSPVSTFTRKSLGGAYMDLSCMHGIFVAHERHCGHGRSGRWVRATEMLEPRIYVVRIIVDVGRCRMRDAYGRV